MIYFDFLRPPAFFDPSAPAYKDWLHVNVLDHESGNVALLNVSLHGAPGDPRSRAVGTALVHVPALGWLGNLEVRSLAEAAIGGSSIGLRRIGLSVNHLSGKVSASVRDQDNGFLLQMEALPFAAPVIVEEPLPLGHGWISWYFVPRLRASGTWTIGNLTRSLATASVYHDHSWGRWHWGDNMGWEWACFLTPSPGPAFVLSRATDRDHRSCGRPTLTVRMGELRRTFSGPGVSFIYSGQMEQSIRRLPGALAALHQDRAHPRLPGLLRVHASDGVDEVTIEFKTHAAAQLITADPMIRGYSFIHEMPGKFTCSGRIGETRLSDQGLGILEYVD
jgi:hypothetical protein